MEVGEILPIDHEIYEVRGLLFVANHDGSRRQVFSAPGGISKANIPVAKGQTLHILAPLILHRVVLNCDRHKTSNFRQEAQPVVSILLSRPDPWKRHTTDDQRIGATIEMLLSPYFIIKHPGIIEKATRFKTWKGCLLLTWPEPRVSSQQVFSSGPV